MSFYDLAAARRSIRKYTDELVPDEDIQTMLKAAMASPSACNAQNWHFVVLNTREAIEGLADAVAAGTRRVMTEALGEDAYINGSVKGNTFFRAAPLVFAVYMEPMSQYSGPFMNALIEKGMTHEDLMDMYMYPDLLTIGASVQNLLLCAQDLGYGGCWMNAPVIAVKEVNEYLGQSAPRRLVSIVPVGRAAYTPREKPLREGVVEYR